MIYTVVTFLALLAVLALLGTVLIGALAVMGRLRPASAVAAVMADIKAVAWLPAAALVAVTSMAGSLFLSEIAHFVPCQLCWFQRIAMYPLAILLTGAAIRRDAGIRPYVLALSAIGGLISAYHYAVQHLPGLPSGSCSLSAPCSAINVEVFGFVTIPAMAFAGFALIFVLALTSPRPEEA